MNRHCSLEYIRSNSMPNPVKKGILMMIDIKLEVLSFKSTFFIRIQSSPECETWHISDQIIPSELRSYTFVSRSMKSFHAFCQFSIQLTKVYHFTRRQMGGRNVHKIIRIRFPRKASGVMTETCRACLELLDIE
jgi:hypothetical protein